MSYKLCLVVTDAISFNVLYRGQLEYLVKNGFDLTLLCGGSRVEIEKLRSRQVGKVVDLGLVRQPRLWVDAFSFLRLLLHFSLHRYDLVVTSTPKALLLASIAAMMARQSRRVAFFQGRVYENFHGIRRRIYLLLDRLTIACVHEVLFVSRSLMGEFAKELPASLTKGRVLGSGSGNGVCMRTFSPNAVSMERIHSLRQTTGIGASEFVVLVVGRMCRDKGLSEIADVVRRVVAAKQEVRFLLVGSAEGIDAQEQLKEMLATGAVVHVEFTPDVVPYFALAHIHLFLTHREGFGNVAIEAAAMGVPTFAFDVVGVRDSVAAGVSGLHFPVSNTESVVKEILLACGNRDSLKKMFSGARSWTQKNFSKEDVWESYVSFYLGVKK